MGCTRFVNMMNELKTFHLFYLANNNFYAKLIAFITTDTHLLNGVNINDEYKPIEIVFFQY